MPAREPAVPANEPMPKDAPVVESQFDDEGVEEEEEDEDARRREAILLNFACCRSKFMLLDRATHTE
jgi:hypothetical protein